MSEEGVRSELEGAGRRQDRRLWYEAVGKEKDGEEGIWKGQEVT